MGNQMGGRIGLDVAARRLAGGMGHKALMAARHLIEDASRFHAIRLIGEQEYSGVWRAEPITGEDCQELFFVWPIGEGEVAGEPVAPGLGLSRYRTLTMSEADLEKLVPLFDDWFANADTERANLAHQWWVNPSHNTLRQAPEEERFPLPIWALDFELVRTIAKCQGVGPHIALTLLGNALKEMMRTRVLADVDRKFLARVAVMPMEDASLIRTNGLLREILSAELEGTLESRLRVLRLFEPDLPDEADVPQELKEFARAAILSSLRTAETAAIEGAAISQAPRTEALQKKQGPGPKAPESRDDVIRQRLLRGEEPGRNVPWSQFYDQVRDDAGGWIDKRRGATKRGFHDKAIQRAAKKFLSLGSR